MYSYYPGGVVQEGNGVENDAAGIEEEVRGKHKMECSPEYLWLS
jgi:hypothetical protein